MRPQRGDKVWIEDETQPNGVIIYVDRKEREVIVKFHETDDIQSFPSDDLEWTDKYGGTWFHVTMPP
jgi:hypothetical protein